MLEQRHQTLLLKGRICLTQVEKGNWDVSCCGGFFGFAESSSTSAEPSQLLCSCSVFYISTLAIAAAEYSALSIADQQGGAAHEYKSKACFVSSCEPEKTEANANAACLVKLIFVEIRVGRSGPICLRLCQIMLLNISHVFLEFI